MSRERRSRFVRRVRLIARRFGVGRLLCVLLLPALVALRVSDPPFLEEIRLRTFDNYQLIKPRVVTQRPVVIVDIDETSLRKLGQWPWPRTVVADIIDKLTEAGAAAIAFDVIFSEPDRSSPDMAADSYRNLDEETRQKLRALPSNDKILAEAFARSRVVVGQNGLQDRIPRPADAPPLLGLATIGPDPSRFLLKFPSLLRNIPVLEKAAAGRGLFTIEPERDGIIRRVPMVMLAEGTIVPSLSFEMLRVVSKADTILVRSDPYGVQSVAVPGFILPTDGEGKLWVHFSRRDKSRYVSAASVLDGTIPADRFQGRLVLIGTSAAGLLDIKTTPVDPAMPGVEVHAQILESALTRAILAAPNWAFGLELTAAVVLGLAIIWLAPILGAWTLLALGAVIVSSLIGTSWYFYTQRLLMIDFTFPLLSSLLIYLTLVFTSYVREQAQKKQIRSAFGQYLSPALVEQLAKSPEKLVLGGEERSMTILFSDVRGFTTLSESFKADPQGLTSLMNRFLTPLTNAILERKGTIDKYMGDAVMAFWNAPIDDPIHQINACSAALDMQESIRTLNAARQIEAEEEGKEFIPINVGVGLNSGSCVVGNMGSDLRFDYSVLGDPVNLASRLEGQTKTYGVPIVAGSSTALAAKDEFAILEIDFITVKGKKEPEVVYAVAGRNNVAQSQAFQTVRDQMIDMLARYRSQDWTGALAAIEKLRHLEGADWLHELFDLYVERIGEFQNNPPPPDWDGVYALQTK